MKFLIIIFPVLLLFSFSAFSEVSGRIVKKRTWGFEKFTKSLSYQFGFSYNSNLKNPELSEHFSSVVYSPSIRSNYFNNIPLSMSLNFTQVKNSDDNFNLGNTVVSTYGEIFKYFSRSHSIILPTSKMSRDIKGSLGSFSNKISFGYKKEFNNGLIFNSSVGIAHVFSLFKFKTDVYGMSNNNNLFTETVDFGMIYKNMSLFSYFGFSQAYSYYNNISESYFLGHSFGIKLNESLGFSLTYSSGGSLMAPNGEDLGIRLFDRDNDTFSLSANYKF